MLRIVRLPDLTVEPAPVVVNSEFGLDGCLRRDGWLVFTPNLDVWGLPLPFGERRFVVAKDTRVTAGRNPRTVWLHPWRSTTIAEYDGVAREVLRELELRDLQFSVAAETASGFMLDGDAGLYTWEPPEEPRLFLDDVRSDRTDDRQTRMACSERRLSGALVIVGLRDGFHLRIAPPGQSRWRTFGGVFSPDGEWLAYDVDYSPERTQEDLQAVAHSRKYEPEPHRLAIIRCSDGATTIADGVFDNFANIAWSLDGEWIALNTPFAPRGLWVTRRDQPRLEWISYGRRRAPSLLRVVSDLVA